MPGSCHAEVEAPPGTLDEVTHDDRYSGGRLAADGRP